MRNHRNMERISFIIQVGIQLEVNCSAFNNYVKTTGLNQDCPL